MAESGLRKPVPVCFEGNVAESWRLFEEDFEIYSAAVLDGKSEKVKAYTMLNLAGTEAIKRSKNFEYAAEIKDGDGTVITPAESKEDPNVLIKKFQALCNPQTNVSMERHIFFSRSQKSGESVESYMTDLKDKASKCEFEDIKDSLIRDRFISGVLSPQLRRVLLKERKLTLTRTIEIAQLDELTQSRLKQFGDSTTDETDINVVKPVKSQDYTETQLCGNCGMKCEKSNCPAKGKQCNHCKKYNHFAKVCRSSGFVPPQTYGNTHSGYGSYSRPPPRRPYRGSHSRGFTRGRGARSTQVYELNDHTDDYKDDEYFIIEDISIDTLDKQEIFVDLNVNNQMIKLKVDTGAKCNVMTKETLRSIAFSQKQPVRIDSSKRVKLVAYGGDSFYTIGCAQLECSHKGESYKLDFHIVNKKVKSILGLEDSMRLKLLYLSPEVDELSGAMSEFEEYKTLFDDGLGKLPVTYKMTVDPKITPVIKAARRIPIAMKPLVIKELDRMEKLGVISKVVEPTNWVSNMVAAKKKDKNEIRICIDPKYLNEALKRPHYPMKTIEDVLSDIPEAKYFTVLDARTSFWQISLDEESSKLTTFATPYGRYKFNRLPYGVVLGSEVFQRSMDELFEKQPCKIIVDDILVWGRNLEEHDMKLRSVLQRSQEINLKLNPQKCRFRVTSVPYVGHILTDKGVEADPDKVKAIVELPVPENVKSLQRFLGMVNYLARFIPKHSELTAPLRDLLKKDTEFRWEANHNQAFQQVKTALSKIATLQYYDVTKSILITSDASQDGLGAACIQEGRPIHFASRALTDTEKHYAQIEKELLAAVFACEKFRQYIFGKPVTVETDHQPLITIMKKSLNEAPTRLQRLIMRLQKFDITFVYKKGSEMHIADTLSRAYLPATPMDSKDDFNYDVMTVGAISDSRMEQLRQSTAKDKTMQNLLRIIKIGWPNNRNELHKDVRPFYSMKDEIIEEDGVLYKGQRVIVPRSLQHEYLLQLHKGHAGAEATKRRARVTVYWPDINDDIDRFVGNCNICIAHTPHQRKEEMLTFPIPDLPWQIVGADIFEWHSNNYLVIADSYSGWYEIEKLEDMRATTVITALKKHFSVHGIPNRLLTDSGPQFSGHEFRDFTKEWDIHHTMSSPHYHQANSIAERAVQSAKKLLQKCDDERSDFYLALLNQRNIPRENALGSPAKRLMSRNTRTLIPQSVKARKPECIENVPIKLKTLRLQKKQYYDKHTRKLNTLKSGDIVRMQTKKGYKQLAVVKKAENQPRSYLVASKGKLYRRNRRHLLHTQEDRKIDQEYRLEDYLDLIPRSLEDSDPVVSSNPETRVVENDTNKHAENSTTPARSNIVPPQSRSSDGNKFNRRGRLIQLPKRYDDFVCNGLCNQPV